ncbi:hypothetical protein ALI144C_26085 [Actinosynnema sp. ALI-1.44]|uniref:hypothetical protein n=1 Tax=Actinosynnema sp. ALI-1.44 TaxID=1933779 RepID=UPI00097BE72E|nr:hypothetical protein [Actinosynnema sp. ALI-1.44]ONI79298.1 hypothetical protein ALI144C_26085 [Actinosynnema sp. ALI-1.44]
MFLSGQEIYENFTNGPGPEYMLNGAGVVAEVVRTYDQRCDQIKSLLGKMDAVWKGDAAGAAHRGVGPLAVEHALAAPAMDTMRDLVDRQAGSFIDARNSVVPVPPAPEKVDPLAAFLRPGDFVTYQQQLSDHNTATQRNVDVMRGYEGASTYNMNMPRTYGSITADQSEIRVAQSAAPPPPSAPSPGDRPSPRKPKQGVSRPPAGIGERPGISPPGADAPGNGPGNTGPATPPSRSSPEPGTTPGGYRSPIPPPGLGTSTDPGSGTGATRFPDTTSGVPAAGAASPARGGVPGVTAGVPGRAGPGGRPGLGGPGAGMGSVGGPGTAAEAAAARNAPAARTTAVGTPMSAVPAGRGRDSEDEDRQRASFLEEPDPEAVFGTDEPTAPPVIGG